MNEDRKKRKKERQRGKEGKYKKVYAWASKQAKRKWGKIIFRLPFHHIHQCKVKLTYLKSQHAVESNVGQVVVNLLRFSTSAYSISKKDLLYWHTVKFIYLHEMV